ncbi:MAG: AI-2E family transporter [Phycisphaerales bacterium]|jgi:predicted PurR-regulated permease PerM|nr:AI-2E family transporter [Phycisphaerales bacterium]MDP6987144.1 AI-2E family transporter [Phycisphaerales bacterium]
MADDPADGDPRHLHLWQIQWVRDLLLIGVLVFLLWLGYAMRDITVPLLVALLLAYLFEPLITFIDRHDGLPFGRMPAIAGLLTVLGAIVVVVLVIVIPMVLTQTMKIAKDVETGQLRTQLTNVAAKYSPNVFKEEALGVIGLLPTGAEDSGATTQQTATTTTSLSAATATGGDSDWLGFAKRTGSMAMYVIGTVLRFGLLAFLIPFYFFFFSLWYPDVVAFCRGLIPDERRDRIERLFGRMDAAVSGFVRGRIVIAFIMGVLLAIGWMIVGVPYAIVLGIVVGVFCAVPFLGLIGIPLSVGLLFLEQMGVAESHRMAWWAMILWPSLVFGIVQALDGWVLTPLIAGKATNLDPVTIFVAVLAGGSVLGAYGMLLAIPIAACVKIMLQDEVLPNLRAWARGDASDPLPIEHRPPK